MPDNFLNWLKLLFTSLRRKRITTVAGAWVYYFLLSFVPLVFLIVSAFSLFGVEVGEEIVARLPEEFRLAGETVKEASERVSKGITVFFIGTVIFSVTSLLNQMSKDGDYIYGCKSIRKRGLFRRLWALIALLVFFLIFLASAIIVAFWNTFFLGLGNRDSVATVTGFTIVIGLSYIVIVFLNKFICPYKVSFRDTLLGSLVSLFIIVIGTIGFVLYIRFFPNYNAFYGSLSTLIVFMLWTYILMLGLSVGAVVNMLVIKNAKTLKRVRIKEKTEY